MNIKMIFFLFLLIALLLLFLIAAGILFLPSYDPAKQRTTYNFITIDGNKIHYYLKYDNQKKETIVFLHSFGGNLEMWNSLISYFQDFNILAYDMPGFGKSDKKLKDYSLSVQSDFLNSLLNRLNIGKVILVGSSMGASVSVCFASAYNDRVNKIILMAPSGYPGSMQHNFPGNYFYKPGLLNSLGKLITGNVIFRKIFSKSREIQ